MSGPNQQRAAMVIGYTVIALILAAALAAVIALWKLVLG